MAKKLFVGNLPYTTTDAELNSVFSEIGTVQSASVIIERQTGRSKGFGFVEMASDEEATRAISELNGRDMGGRSLVVSEARPMSERSDRPSGGNRGGSRFGGGNSGWRDRDNYSE
jgi:cold-inducible RNA-binding protein